MFEARRSADSEMENAKKIAEEKKKEIMDDAQLKVNNLLIVAKVNAEDERQRVVNESKQDVIDLAFSVATKVLNKKISDNEDLRLTEKFVQEL